MSLILSTAVKDQSRVLEPLLPTMLAALHSMACTPLKMDDPEAMKNHNELLRCFEITGFSFMRTLTHTPSAQPFTPSTHLLPQTTSFSITTIVLVVGSSSFVGIAFCCVPCV